MARIDEDPNNLAYDIVRSVAHDSLRVNGPLLRLTRGRDRMMIYCPQFGDVDVWVNGESRGCFNETDGIERCWPPAQ